MTSLLQFKNRKQNSKEFKYELESIPYKNFFSFLHNRAEISSFTHTVHKMWSTTTQHLDFFGLQIKMWKIVRTSKLTNQRKRSFAFPSSPNFNPHNEHNSSILNRYEGCCENSNWRSYWVLPDPEIWLQNFNKCRSNHNLNAIIDGHSFHCRRGLRKTFRFRVNSNMSKCY